MLKLAPVLLLCLISSLSAYSQQITLSSATTQSISNYYQDLAGCSCDVTTSMCDNFCCCDSSCPDATVSAWRSAYQCLIVGSTVEHKCSQDGDEGFGSFEDLACVFYSNRGNIGYYYEYTDSVSSLPTPSKFASVTTTTAQSAITTAINGFNLGTTYSPTNRYIRTASTPQYLYVPLPGLTTECSPGTLNVTTSGTFYCTVTPTAQNCAQLNTPYTSATTLCLNGNCSSTASITTPSASSVSGSNCDNVITGVSLSMTVSSSNSQYSLSSTTLTYTPTSIALNTPTLVTVTVTLTKPVASSGNPGYIVGDQITIPSSLFTISDSTSGACLQTSTTTAMSVPFAVNTTYRCTAASPCTTSFYIDTLPTLTTTLRRYASQSTQTTTVTTTNAGLYGCNTTTYTLNIIYTYAGWALAPQYYILSSEMTATDNPQTGQPSNKYFSINWIYIDPDSVTAPPTNTFYEYFDRLWTPLRQQFGME